MTAALQLELVLEGSGCLDVGTSGNPSHPVLLSSRPPDFPTSRLPDLPTSRLPARLHALGLPPALRVETHANRRVLISLTARGALRVHAGYAMAPDEVLLAIACWARPRTRRAERRAAQRILTAFPVHQHVPPARGPRRVIERVRPGDDRMLGRLRELHQELNTGFFAATLGAIALRLSSRMRRRLGEFRPAEGSHALPEICISRRHLRRDGWQAVRDTLAHEMVHQWQAETGQRLGHDAVFRKRCRAIGIDAHATRRLENDLA